MRKRYGICAAGVTLFALARLVFAQAVEQQVEKIPVLPAVDPEAYKEFMSSQISDINDLDVWFQEKQFNWLQIVPPAEDFILRQPSDELLPFDWKKFPSGFTKNLVSSYLNSVPAFKIVIAEDRQTRSTFFYNEKGDLVFSLPAEPGYNPQWFLKETRPDLFSGRYTPSYVDWMSRFYDPARVQLEVTIIPNDYAEDYLYVESRLAVESASQALTSSSGSGSMLMSYQGPPVTNLCFTTIELITNFIRVTIAYPFDGSTYPTNCFTNRLDVFYSADLLESWWELAATTNVSPSTNWIEWTDYGMTAAWVTVRFYVAGNADIDSDGDGFADAREKFMYHSDPNNSTSKPVNVSGAVSYSGIETDTIHVLAVASSNSWSLGCSTAISGPGTYTNNEIATIRSYWFKAFRDVNSNSTRDAVEPWGIYSASSTLITGDTTGINITMQDVPSISGTINYTGTVAGDIHVIAVTTSNSWSTTYECVIPWVQGSDSMSCNVTYVDFPASYTVIGMPASNYWIRAFIDSDTNLVYTHLETAGQFTSNAIPVSNRVTGINFTLDLDSDGDQMPNWWEWQYGFDPNSTNDGRADRDGDGAENFKEYLFNINPDNTDSDSDGMLDGWEIRYGLTPSSVDATNDIDGDGLNNLDEYLRGTDPNDMDSDNDQISDGPNGTNAIYAGADPNPLTPAPGNIPASLITDTANALAVGEDSKGRPVVAWKAQDGQGKQQIYIMQWFGLASGELGAWAELNGKWEGFGDSASSSGMTKATNGVTMFDMAVDTNGWPAVCWVEGRTGGTNLYYLAWKGTNWQETGGSYTQGIANVFIDSFFYSYYHTNSGSGEYIKYAFTGRYDACSLAFDTSNKPLVTYLRYFAGGPPTASIQFKYYDGAKWSGLGSSTNSGGISGGAGAYYMSQVVVGPDNRPVVAYFQWYSIGYHYIRKWNPVTTNWDLHGGSVPDSTTRATDKFDLSVDRSNKVGVAYQRAEYTTGVQPYKYALRYLTSTGGTWSGYGGSDAGLGLCQTNAGTIEIKDVDIYVQSNGLTGVSWIQWGGLAYNWLYLREGTNWSALGTSFSDYGLNSSGQRIGEVKTTPGNNQQVVGYTEQTGTGSSDPYKLVVRQYQADTDGDGLSDNYEAALGLNQNSSDTDADGLTDGDELLIYATSATNAYSDGDGLTDFEEIFGTAYGYTSNPLLNDSDGDGIDDGVDLFTNSFDSDQDGDLIPDYLDTDDDDDNDGLLDVDETTTDPLNPDSSGDGIPDGLEGVPDSTAPVIYIIEPEEGVTL